MAKLPAAVVDLLAVASVVGRRFPIAMAAAIAGAPAEMAVPLADSAVRAAVLEQDEPGHLRFSHDLFRDVLYGGLPAARRSALHLSVAGLLEHPRAFEPPVVAVLSGGNIDPLLLAKVLRHGLAAAGRYLTFRCRLPDRPGALATLLAEVAGLGANVLDVVHERVTPGLHVDEVEVLLQVETRGPAHCDSVIGQLRASGYKLLFT